MRRQNRINDVHMATMLFALCWVAYFASYIGRLNFSSAMPEMLKCGILNKSEAGFISMLYFFAYGIGQLINGFLGDKLQPRKMIFIGLFLAGVMNIIMGSAPGFYAMAVFWCANGYLQSMIWPPILRIFAEMMNEYMRIKSSINITSTMAIGTLTSYLLSALMMRLFGWRAVFYAAAVIMCTAAVVVNVKFRKIEKYAEEHGEAHVVESGKEEMPEAEVPFVKLLAGSGVLLILVPIIVHGVLKDGVTSWVPTYIHEVFGTTATFSILLTMVLPVINLTGAYAAQMVYQKFKKQEIKSASVFFTTATAALLLLWQFGSVSAILTAVLFAVITSCMYAVNTLFVNLLPIRFVETGHTAAVSGFLNSMAYVGTAVSTFTIGIIVEKAGWQMTILGWFLITGVATVICISVRKWKFKIQTMQN